jgi:aspartyl aminopeptidase
MNKESGWLSLNKKEKKEVFSFNTEYISFLNTIKTEREAAEFIKEKLKKNGFKDINEVNKLQAGDKVFYFNKNKSVYAAIIGSNDLSEGLNIVGSHIDSPRIDLKPNPLYEKVGQALFDTHYYGGIKKYQWTTIPLSLHGVIIKNDGTKITLNIGEKDTDPIFTISDLLPHLAKKQEDKKLTDAIVGEDLDALVGNIPEDNDHDAVSKNILKILKDKYNIKEEDFYSSELELVPAFKARSLGFDESMVAGYGQDDRSCSYANLMALLNITNPTNTCLALFADKEEIGSVGNTGMMSKCFDNFIIKLLTKTGNDPYNMTDILVKSKMLSADVDAAIDPNYLDAFTENNSAYLSKGVTINKYTGARGKSGASDANAEYVAYVRNIFEKNKVLYQFSELGKVDQGGGGTIAYILANKGVDVLDCGLPILSMHSPYEVSSKLDIYMAYLAYQAFFNDV